MSDSTVPFKRLDPSKIRVLLLSTGQCVIAIIENEKNGVLSVKAPVNLRTVYNEASEILGYITEPFMTPFVEKHNPNKIVQINLAHVVSDVAPNDFILERYVHVTESYLNGITPLDPKEYDDITKKEEAIPGEKPLSNEDEEDKEEGTDKVAWVN